MVQATKKQPTGIIFAGQVAQEFSFKLSKIASIHDVHHGFSQKTCRFGNIGFYAEFDNNEQKRDFLNDIKEIDLAEVWAS